MEIKLYYGMNVCYNSVQIFHVPYIFIGESIEKAMNHGVQEMMKTHPKEQGYYGHRCQMNETPDNIMELIKKEFCK